MGSRGDKTKLMLEDYTAFFYHLNRDLTVDQLNRIAVLHGYYRLHHRNKADMLEIISSLELMSPKRSTINCAPSPVAADTTLVPEDRPTAKLGRQRKTALNISAPKVRTSAELTVEEVRECFEAIGWQECPVKSISTVGSRLTTSPTTTAIQVLQSELSSPMTSSSSKRKRNKRRKKEIADVLKNLAGPDQSLNNLGIESEIPTQQNLNNLELKTVAVPLQQRMIPEMEIEPVPPRRV